MEQYDESLIYEVRMGGYNYRVCCEVMIKCYAGIVLLDDKLV